MRQDLQRQFQKVTVEPTTWDLEEKFGVQEPAETGALRGGSWPTSNRTELQSSYRNVGDWNDRDVSYGFRCVLAVEKRGEDR